MLRNLYNVSLKTTLFASILIIAGCGDDNNPVDPDHGEEHAEALGLIIRNSGEEILRYENGQVSGKIDVGRDVLFPRVC